MIARSDPPLQADPAEAELLRSGNTAQAAARSGFLPVPLEQVIVASLSNIPVHLNAGGTVEKSRFPLYCSESSRFTEFHRTRLREAGARFIYIPMAFQTKFQQQVERELINMAADPGVAIHVKSSLLYETSLELIDEVLSEQGIAKALPRLDRVSRAVSKMVVTDKRAFAHLFSTAQHDFYTATHMVNVGTWMVSLACAMGIHDEAELEAICTAGMVHDVGKVFVPEEVLNKPGSLSDGDWQLLRAHPVAGVEHLKKQGVTSELVLRVTREHHERIDGTGYPDRIKGDQMHRASKICAVVDSFDAMTACRPFKNRVKSIAEAVSVLKAETPEKYDPDVVDAWVRLLQGAAGTGMIREPVIAAAGEEGAPATPTAGRRRWRRFGIDCPAKVHVLTPAGESWQEGPAVMAKSHNISEGGVGLLTPKPLQVTQQVRVYLKGKGTLQDRVCEGIVVRCRSYKDGWHEVGVRLCEAGSEEGAGKAMTTAV